MGRSRVSLEFCLERFGIKKSTYYGWFSDDGSLKDSKPRAPVNDRKILTEEILAVLNYRRDHPDIGYRKLAWQMVDENVACLSETAVYNILSKHGMLHGWARPNVDPADKEYRHKPKYPHYHWHTDIAYIKIQGIFYFLIMLLDGYSRMLLGWELMTDMLGSSVETFIQKVKEKYPHAKPRLIHDNGSQFISLDFVRLVQTLEIQQIRTRRNHPQTNGKIERMNGTTKNEAIRPAAPSSYQEALEILKIWEYQYNYQRLHAGISYLRPADMFFGRGKQILNERVQKLEIARSNRRQKNREATVTAQTIH
jgi:transposase InsO family protein